MTGLVASMDEHVSRYAAFSSVQDPRTEIIVELEDMMTVCSFSKAELEMFVN